MSKFITLVFVLGILIALGYVIRQQMPDIQRYLRISTM
jgi:hypothetical protein